MTTINKSSDYKARKHFFIVSMATRPETLVLETPKEGESTEGANSIELVSAEDVIKHLFNVNPKQLINLNSIYLKGVPFWDEAKAAKHDVPISKIAAWVSEGGLVEFGYYVGKIQIKRIGRLPTSDTPRTPIVIPIKK